MANIKQLIPDIQALLQTNDWMTDSLADEHAQRVAIRMQEMFTTPKERRGLRLSSMGPRCPCALYHSVHHPENAQPLVPWARFKYSFGHMIEAWAITLARAAGHSVQGEQDAVFAHGIKGHRDCVVDGCLVDVKGVSSRQYPKFRDKTLVHDDMFGYLDQLDGYLVGCLEDPIVEVKDRAYDWAIGLEKGHMCLYEHHFREDHIRERIEAYKRIVARREPPVCECRHVAEGESGNFKLDTRASYDDQKYSCFPNLRCFIYAKGPVYLTKVVRKPDVIEVDKNGKVVYN